jgi:ADP-heptose:LPS heptosyltransferase
VRILLYRSGALGDTLLILPALDTLREKFPGARLHLAAHPPYAAPLLDAGRADTAAGAGAKSILDAGSPPFHLLHQESRPDFPDDLTKLFSGFDLIALFTNDPDGAAARRLDSVPERGSAAARTATRGIVAPPFPPEGDEGHVSEWMVRALAPLSVKPPADPPPPLLPLAPSPEIRAGAAKLIGEFSLAPKKFLAIHPAAGAEANGRRWGRSWKSRKTFAARQGPRFF